MVYFDSSTDINLLHADVRTNAELNNAADKAEYDVLKIYTEFEAGGSEVTIDNDGGYLASDDLTMTVKPLKTDVFNGQIIQFETSLFFINELSNECQTEITGNLTPNPVENGEKGEILDANIVKLRGFDPIPEDANADLVKALKRTIADLISFRLRAYNNSQEIKSQTQGNRSWSFFEDSPAWNSFPEHWNFRLRAFDLRESLYHDMGVINA